MRKIVSNGEQNRNLCVLAAIFIFLFYAGCAPSWVPSDDNAAKLVRDHYLFFSNGETVQATVAERGEYIKECGCYPIKFNIVFSNGSKSTKTFYFYKNSSGDAEIKEYIGSNYSNAN